jgi:hypothetical protein
MLYVPSQKIFWLGSGTITNFNTLVDELSLFWLGTDTITTSNTLVHDLSLFFWFGTDNMIVYKSVRGRYVVCTKPEE